MDSGSAISCMKGVCIPNEIVLDSAADLEDRYSGINSSKVVFRGTRSVNVTIGSVTKCLRIAIVPDGTMKLPVLLGQDAFRAFNLSITEKRTISVEAVAEILNIEVEEMSASLDTLVIDPKVSKVNADSIKELFQTAHVNCERPPEPKVKVELKLELTKHELFHYSPRRLAYDEKCKLRVIVERLLERKIIQPSESEYASPIVLIKKKNGELRMCVDYRTLDKLIARDNYPLPLIEDQLDMLNGKKYFTLLDLKDGFHHVSVAKDSVKYTAFITPIGQYEYLKMPFGLKTAPSRFQRFVNQALSEVIRTGDVVVYLDDFLVASDTIEHHFKVLETVFRLLVENKLELRIDK